MKKLPKFCWLCAIVVLGVVVVLFFERSNAVEEKVIAIRYSHYASGCNVYQTMNVPRKVSQAAEERRYEDSRRFLSEFLQEWQKTDFAKAIKANVGKRGIHDGWTADDLDAALEGLRFELIKGIPSSGSARGRVIIRAKGVGLANCLAESCMEEMRQSVEDFSRLQFMRQASNEQSRMQRMGRELKALREQAAGREASRDQGVSGLEAKIRAKEAEVTSIALEIEKIREKCARDGAVIELTLM